jgi:Lrp/AsnC family leucine-responsive transcriptional regulator
VEIKLSSKSNEIFHQFKKDVLKLPHVLECHLLSGDFDYLVKARISEISHYRELLGETLLSLPYARESRSYMVMEEVKENFILPVS